MILGARKDYDHKHQRKKGLLCMLSFKIQTQGKINKTEIIYQLDIKGVGGDTPPVTLSGEIILEQEERKLGQGSRMP